MKYFYPILYILVLQLISKESDHRQSYIQKQLLNIFKPLSKEVQKYVEHYYVFSGERPETISYIAFPHIYTGLSFFRNVIISRGDHEIQIEAGDNERSVHIEILGRYIKPVFVHYRGNFEEVAIIFKPFGINPFIGSNTRLLLKDFSQALELDNWTRFATILFSVQATADRIRLIDEFLIANICRPDDNWLGKALEHLESTSTAMSIAEIARLSEMTIKTFQRNFRSAIGYTPSEYRRVARFRKSVHSKVISNELKNLTEITYAFQYYDQSYFIREFKKLTKLSPRRFFKSITVLDKAGIVWEIR